MGLSFMPGNETMQADISLSSEMQINTEIHLPKGDRVAEPDGLPDLFQRR